MARRKKREGKNTRRQREDFDGKGHLCPVTLEEPMPTGVHTQRGHPTDASLQLESLVKIVVFDDRAVPIEGKKCTTSKFNQPTEIGVYLPENKNIKKQSNHKAMLRSPDERHNTRTTTSVATPPGRLRAENPVLYKPASSTPPLAHSVCKGGRAK